MQHAKRVTATESPWGYITIACPQCTPLPAPAPNAPRCPPLPPMHPRCPPLPLPPPYFLLPRVLASARFYSSGNQKLTAFSPCSLRRASSLRPLHCRHPAGPETDSVFALLLTTCLLIASLAMCFLNVPHCVLLALQTSSWSSWLRC